MIQATKEFLAEIDKLAEAKKNNIRNTESDFATNGKLYYVSENGNDNNDGLSPATALKTLEKASELQLCEGDVILLERGSFFRGHLNISTEHITVSAYGKGPKPIICGSPENGAKPHYWSLVDGTDNIYIYYKDMSDIGGMLFDEGKVCGIKRVPNFVDGRFINSDKNEFDVKTDLKDNYAFFSEVKNELNNGRPMIHDAQKHIGKLYLRCDEGNPGEVFTSIEFFERGSTIRVSADYCTIDNICMLYCGTHSVGSGTRNGLTVRNTEIGWAADVFSSIPRQAILYVLETELKSTAHATVLSLKIVISIRSMTQVLLISINSAVQMILYVSMKTSYTKTIL